MQRKRKKQRNYKADDRFGTVTLKECLGAVLKSSRHNVWLAKCDCNKEVKIPTAKLYARKYCSPDCSLKPKQTNLQYENNCELYYKNYIKGARRRKYAFTLTLEEFEEITKKDCYYCGSPPRKLSHQHTRGLIANGVDRKNSIEGYSIDNCVPCCTLCNMTKNKMSDIEFIELCKRIAEKHNA